jgi:hypothetical protein
MKQFLLTPAAGKRLIGIALAAHPAIQAALSSGTLIKWLHRRGDPKESGPGGWLFQEELLPRRGTSSREDHSTGKAAR